MAKSKKKARRVRHKADSSLWAYSAIPIGLGVLGAVVAFAVIVWQVVLQGNETFRTGNAQARADAYQAAMNARIESAQVELLSMAASDVVINTLTTYQADVLSARSAELGNLMHYAERVDVIQKGSAEVDLNADVPISFAALDLIKRAETQAFVGPEIALNQRQYAYVAAPITVEGAVRGVLFAALRAEYFYQVLAGFEETGVARVQQQFERGASPTTVLQHGDSKAPAGAASINRPLAVPHWQLDYVSVSDARIASWLDLLAPFAMIVALMLGGILIGFTRLFSTLEKDADQLTEYLARRLRGRSPPLEPYKLPLIQRIAQSVQPRGGERKPTAPTPLPTTVEEEDDDEADLLAPATTAEQDTEGAEDAEGADVDAIEDDEEDDFLEVAQNSKPGPGDSDNFGIEVSESGPAVANLDAGIFRAYDIRGVVPDNLNDEVAYYIGRAFASEAAEFDQPRAVVGRDGRHSSQALKDALIRGLVDGGMDVTDIGQAPTPLLYYATHALNTGTGIMVTGSHNPPEYNGLKLMLAGVTLDGDRIQDLRARIDTSHFTEGTGGVDEVNIVKHYIDRVLDDVAIAQPLKVVVDCGNGVAGLVAPQLLEEMGCEIVPLYCEVDGSFPNHHPDPANPDDLITVVKDEQADLGLAFDGDGDRLGLVTKQGTIIWPDKMMMLFARDIVGRNPGADIVYDVKCSRHLNNVISESGGRPIMWKTGHSHIKAHVRETGALLGGEFSGHICFAERWYGFDDALYSAARLLEIVSAEADSVDELFAAFPTTFSTPEIQINTSEAAKFTVLDKLGEQGEFGSGALTTIDGIRVDYEDGWGLVRPSNTAPVLTLRFEADTDDALNRIQDVFRAQLAAVDSALTF